MSTIDLEITVKTEIGIMPSEQGREQLISISIGVDIDRQAVTNASSSGEISHTLDYTLLRQIVLDVFALKRFNLLEEPALQIKDRVSALPHVQEVRVCISKIQPWPDVPVVRVTV